MTERTPNTLHRFIDATQRAITLGATENSDLNETGAGRAIGELRAAVPIAEAILLLGSPLDTEAEPLTRYIFDKHRAIEAESEQQTDPDHECDKAAATEAAIFSVALAMGLLLADRV